MFVKYYIPILPVLQPQETGPQTDAAQSSIPALMCCLLRQGWSLYFIRFYNIVHEKLEKWREAGIDIGQDDDLLMMQLAPLSAYL